jgi:hypothetical protein
MSTSALTAGQVWKTDAGYLRIARIGRLLAEYKLTKGINDRASSTRMAPLKSIADYLQEHRAELVP